MKRNAARKMLSPCMTFLSPFNALGNNWGLLPNRGVIKKGQHVALGLLFRGTWRWRPLGGNLCSLSRLCYEQGAGSSLGCGLSLSNYSNWNLPSFADAGLQNPAICPPILLGTPKVACMSIFTHKWIAAMQGSVTLLKWTALFFTNFIHSFGKVLSWTLVFPLMCKGRG